MEMFQQAQEASDQGRYEQALAYYEEFIRRFPDDQASIVEAEYEIAFLAYKQDQLPEARQQFEDILEKYESDGAEQLPAWPRILSEKLIERIDDRMDDEGLLRDTSPRGAGDPGPSADPGTGVIDDTDLPPAE